MMILPSQAGYFSVILVLLLSHAYSLNVFAVNNQGNQVDIVKQGKVIGSWDYKPGKEHSCRVVPTAIEKSDISQRQFTIHNDESTPIEVTLKINHQDFKEMSAEIKSIGSAKSPPGASTSSSLPILLKKSDSTEYQVDYNCQKSHQSAIGWGRVEFQLSIKRLEQPTSEQLSQETIIFSLMKICEDPPNHYDPSIIILMLTSCLFVAFGAYQTENPIIVDQEEQTQEISKCHALFFIILGSGSLVVMYFLYEDIEIVLLCLVLISAFSAMSLLIDGFLENQFKKYNLPNNQCVVPFLGDITITWVISAVIAVIIIAVYVITRSWIASNIIAAAIVILMFRVIRLPSYMVAALLLGLAFFYDIFWVFYSERLFGTSVMASVATRVELPMMFYCPKFGASPIQGCSLIGLGDIVLPGVFVGYCLSFGKRIAAGVQYYIVCLSGYILGIMICVICLIGFHTAQPALLYLSPCTLIPVGLLGVFRKEFMELWTGSVDQNNKRLQNSSGSRNNNGTILTNEKEQLQQTLGFKPLEVSDNDLRFQQK